ncbi:hypothetical protein POM88_020122 [Heracleum sosnowskyi]|uniref:Uncharacterized protein n=1 Tax=Heracleum sosnowskyi TaxID=360622 RepID=A0AAD8IAT0_9APIA|nr:hypothetical protein POM88_020122 [Heracleum sosnowskyi]
MGNCMETFPFYQEKDETRKVEDQEAEVDENQGDFVKESTSGFQDATKVRIKVVLSKEELEWLVFELENHKNERSLEDILEEIESSRESYRGKIVSWKPSLESIKESPEVLEMER